MLSRAQPINYGVPHKDFSLCSSQGEEVNARLGVPLCPSSVSHSPFFELEHKRRRFSDHFQPCLSGEQQCLLPNHLVDLSASASSMSSLAGVLRQPWVQQVLLDLDPDELLSGAISAGGASSTFVMHACTKNCFIGI